MGRYAKDIFILMYYLRKLDHSHVIQIIENRHIETFRIKKQIFRCIKEKPEFSMKHDSRRNAKYL